VMAAPLPSPQHRKDPAQDSVVWHRYPKKRQAFGKVAKKHTSRLVAGKTAEVTSYDTDKYGRTVGVVVADGVNVNQNQFRHRSGAKVHVTVVTQKVPP
jgi:endonuclease YncB( thermonuclease family)